MATGTADEVPSVDRGAGEIGHELPNAMAIAHHNGVDAVQPGGQKHPTPAQGGEDDPEAVSGRVQAAIAERMH